MLLDNGRGAQAVGIPQVIETPAKFFDMARYIREEILGKPASGHYDEYETYLEALIDWKLDQPSPHQAAETKPLLDDFETYEAFRRAS